jgi:4-amino-4-deoxy-L-arabinose transferase-like glycosyltransferase
VAGLSSPLKRKFDLPWIIWLAGLSLYSGFSYLYNLASGQRSEFYAAIATSMSKSLSNFWWGAADPAGTITLDKIPGSYWFPAIFVKLFGFSTWSVNAPNAIASVVLVIVVAYAAREIGGRGAGLIAGAIAASTPILSAVARSNQPQSFLLLWLSVATLFGVKALKRNSFWHLFGAGAFIALAFHSYMLVAWAMWPALGIAYLFTKQKWVTKIWHLLVAGLSSLLLSLVWIISVTLTPASARPYIGGSNTNSAWEMVFGYNGLGRFSDLTSGTSVATTVRGFTPPFSGEPSLFRLLNSQLLPQIGWLVPATLVGIIVIFALKNFKPTAIFASLFFLVYAAMFSVVAGMHQFYTSALAIPMALVLAIAYSTARESNRTWGKIPVIATAVISAAYVGIQYSSYMLWAPVVQFLIGIVAVLMILLQVKGKAKVLLPLAIAGSLVFSPAVWAADTVSYPSSINPLAGPTNSMGGFGAGNGGFGAGKGGLPQGGTAPSAGGGFSGGFPGGASANDNKALISYLQKNRNGAKFLMATFTTMSAASYINATGDNVLPIGGFDGSDPSPTLKQIKTWVADGDLQFVLEGGQAGPRGQAGASASTTSVGQSNLAQIQSWVTTNCALDTTVVSAESLYKCSPASLK